MENANDKQELWVVVETQDALFESSTGTGSVAWPDVYRSLESAKANVLAEVRDYLQTNADEGEDFSGTELEWDEVWTGTHSAYCEEQDAWFQCRKVELR